MEIWKVNMEIWKVNMEGKYGKVKFQSEFVIYQKP